MAEPISTGLFLTYMGSQALSNIFSAHSQRKAEERRTRFAAEQAAEDRALSRETRDIGLASQQMNQQFGLDLSRQQQQEKRAALVRGILSNMVANRMITHGAPAGWGQTPVPRVPTAPQIAAEGRSISPSAPRISDGRGTIR